ncbi:DUF255 domain-containing protein [Balneolaceae bacterium ANBcel3]|nr:DUF255 domain-containing protein [Balneolaceae bacterium ANBcel3]
MNIRSLFITGLLLAMVIVSCDSDSKASELHTHSESAEGNWVLFEDALEMASAQEKYIVVDIYTDWCPYCRRMLNQTYANDTVQETIETYFYAVRLDAESNERIRYNGQEYSSAELAYAFGAVSYPTTLFLTPDAEPIATQTGYIPKDTFNQMLKYIGTGSYESLSFQQFVDKEK